MPPGHCITLHYITVQYITVLLQVSSKWNQCILTNIWGSVAGRRAVLAKLRANWLSPAPAPALRTAVVEAGAGAGLLDLLVTGGGVEAVLVRVVGGVRVLGAGAGQQAWDLPVEGGRVAGGWVGARLVALLTDPAPLTAVPVYTRGATRHCQQWYRCRQRALANLGSCDLVLTVWDRATRQTWERCLT